MSSESEWLTRKRRIDPKLDARGWRLPSGNPAQPLSVDIKDASFRMFRAEKGGLGRAGSQS